MRDCICRTLKKHTQERPLVVLTSKGHLRKMRNRLAVSLPVGSSCYGSSWVDPDGRMVSLKSYGDLIPAYPKGFDLKVCNDGATYTPDELKGLAQWRAAANAR